MNKKNIIILILALLVIGLGYSNFSNKEVVKQSQESVQIEDKSEDYFAHNQECLKYKDEIAVKLKNKDSSFGETSLEQIFYSPKENSCLYVEHSFMQGDLLKREYMYTRRLYDILDDGYNSNPLEACFSLELGDEEECNIFEKMLEKYK